MLIEGGSSRLQERGTAWQLRADGSIAARVQVCRMGCGRIRGTYIDSNASSSGAKKGVGRVEATPPCTLSSSLVRLVLGSDRSEQAIG